MEDRLKVINFLQDFGCTKLSHLYYASIKNAL